MFGQASVHQVAEHYGEVEEPILAASRLPLRSDRPTVSGALVADRARDAGIVVVPAMAFYGGLGDLLATVAMGRLAGR